MVYYGYGARGRGLLAFLYIILSLYFINKPFQFVVIPQSFLSVEPWIIFIGGILLILGGFNLFRSSRYGF